MMKRLTILLFFLVTLLAVAPFAFGAAYTSSQTGNWSSTATWGGSGPPGDGDTVTIDTGHTVTVDQHTTVGDSPDPAAAVISCNTTGALTVAAGVTLTVKGGIQGEDGAITFEAGAHLIINVGAGLSYGIHTSKAHNDTCTIVINGASESWVSISKTGDGTAYISGNELLRGGNIVGQYCTFTDMGSASVPSVYFWASHADDSFSADYFIFDGCGRVKEYSNTGTESDININHCTWKNSADTVNLYLRFNALPAGSEQRNVTNNVFDADVQLLTPAGLTITGNLFGIAFTNSDAAWSTFSNNLVVKAAVTDTNVQGDVSSTYFLVDTATANPHFIKLLNYDRDQSVTDSVFEYTGAGDDGDCITLGNPANPRTATISGNIVLPASSGSGNSSGTLFSALGGANVTINATRNTVFAGPQGAAVGETYVGHAGMVSKFASNLSWNSSEQGYKLFDSGTNDAVADLVTAANCDYNAGYSLLAGSNLKGYNNLEFSSGSPGAHDVDGQDPQFEDATINIAKWDASLGGAGTTENALAELAKMNDASGYDSNYTIAALISWVRAGFVPHNSALDGAGEGGVDIGAMDVVLLGPAITSGAGAVIAGASYVLTGTDFGGTEGTVTLNSVTQTVTAWADTEITFTVSGTLTPGTSYDIVVTDSSEVASDPYAVTAGGSVYYVDYSTGADTNNGTSTSTPWKHSPSMASASDISNGTTLQPGDQVLFNSGVTWPERIAIPASGVSGYPITYGAYGISANPVINIGTTMPGWALKDGYSNTYYVADTDAAHDFLYVLDSGIYRPLTRQTSLANVEANAGSWWLDDAGDECYIHLWDSAAPGTRTIYKSDNGNPVIAINNKDYITVTGLTLVGGTDGVKVYGGSTNSIITANYIYCQSESAIIFRGAGTDTHSATYNYSRWTGNGIRGYATGDAASNLTFAYNQILDTNSAGEFVADGEGISNQGCSNVTEYGNVVTDPGGHGISHYMSNGDTGDSISIYNEIITGAKKHGIVMSGDGTGNYTNTTVKYCKAVNGTGTDYAGVYLTVPGNSSSAAYNCTFSGFKNNIQQTAAATGWTIENCYSYNPLTYHFAQANGAETNTVANYNAYYHESGTKYWAWAGTARTTLSAHQTDAAPQQASSVQATSDPFVNATADNYQLKRGATGVDAGKVISGIHTQGVSTDLAGNKIWNQPDIGAYELQQKIIIPPGIIGSAVFVMPKKAPWTVAE